MVIQEDLGLCYPEQYYALTNENEGSANASSQIESTRRLSQLRDSLRYGIVRAVQGVSEKGVSASLTRVLAMSRRLRERAFGQLADELIPRTHSPLRALDIGCGSGALVAALGRAGWDVEGVEWNAFVAEGARRATGRTIWAGDFRKIDLPIAAYSLIVLSHVFEHLNDPNGALRQIRQLLAPNGRLVLFYPNPESIGARIYGDAWFPWEVPRHLVLPPIHALARAASRVGLEPVVVRTHSRYAAGYFAHSRAYKAGRKVDLFCPEINIKDKLIAAAERFLNRLVFTLGEEAIVVLEKR